MNTQELKTRRKQRREIKKLADKGKTPHRIGRHLDLTRRAVERELRRGKAR